MKIAVYLPLFGSMQIHPKTFKSFVEMLSHKVEGYEIVPFIHTVGPELSYNRNDVFARILDMNADFIMCCDADIVFPREAISNLVNSIGDAGGCTGLYWRKANPHRCVIGHYIPWDSHSFHYKRALGDIGFIDSSGEQCLFYKAIEEISEVSQIDVFGMGCVLLRAESLRQLKQPYFKYFDGYQTGDHSFGPISEEMVFCASLHKAGVKVLADPRVKCGHITELIVSEPKKAVSCV